MMSWEMKAARKRAEEGEVDDELGDEGGNEACRGGRAHTQRRLDQCLRNRITVLNTVMLASKPLSLLGSKAAMASVTRLPLIEVLQRLSMFSRSASLATKSEGRGVSGVARRKQRRCNEH